MKYIGVSLFFAAVFVVSIAVSGEKAGLVFEGDWGNPNRGAPESAFAFTKLKHTFENQTSLWEARFDDGSCFYGYILNYKFAVYEKWGATAALIDSDGSRHIAKVEFPRSSISYSPDSITFRAGKSYQDGKYPLYRYYLETENCLIDLYYRNFVPPFIPGDGVTWYDDEKKTFLKNMAFCPWGRVSGVIEFDGKRRVVKGQGYADRDHANQIFTKQIKEMHTYRGWPENPDDGLCINVIEYISGPQYNGLIARWLTVMKKGEILMATRDFSTTRMNFVRDASTGFEYPTKWRLEACDAGVSIDGEWSSSRLMDVLDVFNEIPAPLRPIARRFFTRPVFYRMTGNFEGTFTNSAGESIPVKIKGMYKAVYTK